MFKKGGQNETLIDYSGSIEEHLGMIIKHQVPGKVEGRLSVQIK